MLASGLAPCTALDGNHDDRINNRFCLFCGAERLLVIDPARGIATIADQHDNLASLALIERMGCHSASRRRARWPRPRGCDRFHSSTCLRSAVYPVGRAAHGLAEAVDAQSVDSGAGSYWRSVSPRRLFQRQAAARAQAGVDGQRNGKRQRRFFIENRNLLLGSVSSFSVEKFCFVNPPTGDPWSSVTVTKTFTSFTSTLRVVSGSC